MKCSRVRDRFTEYIEGTLKGGELRAVEEHLARCEECSRELSHIRELDARLRREVPAYWESLEPSAGFVSRLKSMDLEPERSRGFSLIDSIFGLWENHRVALSGAMAVCLIVALALAIPAVVNDNGDDSTAPMAAEGTPDSSYQEFSASSRAPGETLPQGPAGPLGPQGTEAEPPTGMAVAETPSPTTEDGGAYSKDVASPQPTLPPEPTEESENALVCGEAAKGSNTAIDIALDSDEVQEALQGKDVHCVEVLEGVELEGYTCSGSTVAIFT
ncbi:MAG: zf-HC2 domain-containing protein, partial [Dehalococcoidia bacterium]